MNGKSTFVSVADGEARLEQRATFDYIFAFIFLAAMHGFSALKILLILYLNFKIATSLPRKFVPAATWVFNIGILFANELSDGYKYTGMAAYLSPLENGAGFLNELGMWMDRYGGIMRRWEVLFNITVLRLISFNLDYYFSLDTKTGSLLEVCSLMQSEYFLTSTRRNNSTLPVYLNETASKPPRHLRTILFVII